MRPHFCICLAVLLLLCVTSTVAQKTGREIKLKEKELQKLRNDIQTYEKKLKESEKREKTTLERLDYLEHQSILIRQLIQKLRDEENEITTEIDTAKGAIADLENRLQFLKSHYANYVRSVYKNGRVYNL